MCSLVFSFPGQKKKKKKSSKSSLATVLDEEPLQDVSVDGKDSFFFFFIYFFVYLFMYLVYSWSFISFGTWVLSLLFCILAVQN